MVPHTTHSLREFTPEAADWLVALPEWQALVVLVGGSVVAAAIVQVGGDVLLRRLTARIDGDVDDVVFGYVHLAVWLSILVAGPYVGLSELGILGGLAAPLGAGALTFVVLVWAFALIRAGPPVFRAITDTTSLERQVVPIFQNVWTVGIASGGLFALLVVWEIDVTPLLASAGLAGIVVGLAARDTIANFFGSIALYADGTYAVGDYVVLESGERGRVEDVTVRSTIIRTRDDVLVTIPNSKLSNAAIVNESTPRRHRRVKVPVSVAYGTDIDEVESIMLAVAQAEELVRERPKARVRVREFGDSGIRIELLAWIDDPRFTARARDVLLRGIYREFQAADVEIPYPQREVRVREGGLDGVADTGDARVESVEPAGRRDPGRDAEDGSKAN